jgi:hypothetical protein
MGILKVTKTIRCTAYYHLYLSKHYAFEMRTQFFDFERLKPVRVTKRNLQEDRRGNLICCMQCGRVISLRTGRGSKKKTPRPTGLFETFQSFFLGAGYPDVDPSPSSKTTVSIFFFSAGSPGWNPTTWSTWKWTFGSQLWQRGNYNLSMYCIDIQELVCIVLIVNPASPEWLS